MTRLLVLGLLVVVLWLAVDNLASRLKRALSDGNDQKGRVPPPRPPVTETLLPCAVCGTYVPATRALKAAGGGEGRVFCSEECRSRA